jgi:hypothetical protein
MEMAYFPNKENNLVNEMDESLNFCPEITTFRDNFAAAKRYIIATLSLQIATKIETKSDITALLEFLDNILEIGARSKIRPAGDS